MVFECGIAVFARTPGSGGKSRLAGTWGRDRTDLFYGHCLKCAAAWLAQSPNPATCYWAVTGPGSRDDSCWRDIATLEQGEGGLGERMARIADLLHARHGCWCLVGTDIPQMRPTADLGLMKRLAESEFVFGPAADGGFWLAAGRQPLPRRLWTEVPYSRPDTLARLLAALSRELPDAAIDFDLPTMHDVDRQSDLAALIQDLESRKSVLTPAQLDLLCWLHRESGVTGGEIRTPLSSGS